MTGRQNARIKAVLVLLFIHVAPAHFANLLAAKVQFRGLVGSRKESKMSFSRANTLDTSGPGRRHRRRQRCLIVVPCSMTGRQLENAQIKSSDVAAFYPCCALCRALGSEGSVQGSVGGRRESGMSFTQANDNAKKKIIFLCHEIDNTQGSLAYSNVTWIVILVFCSQY